MTQPTASQVRAALKAIGNPAKSEEFAKFYRAFPGGYGEGDKLLVIPVPEQRKIAKQNRSLPRNEVIKLLRDPYHECRLTALFIMTHQYQRGDAAMVDIFLEHLDFVNNWDLVDSSAHKILGDSLIDQSDRAILYELADSNHLWRERVSVVACLALIKNDDFCDIQNLADHFLNHPHDLIHKAVGWMLREMGKRDESVLTEFLESRYRDMPRTMLRYAIEKFDRDTRTAYLRGEI